MPAQPSPTVADDHVLAGGGAMGEHMRSIDWAATAIGPVSGWSPVLRTMVGLVLRNRFPILVWWGPQYVQFYNDAFQPILGDKHAHAMGQPGPECWAEIWDVVGPMAEVPMRGGDATWNDDLVVLMNRRGFPEETHFKLAYSPVPDETVPGTGIGGVIATVAETSEQIFGARQMRTLRDLGARLTDARTIERVGAETMRTLVEAAVDVPFAFISWIGADGRAATLAAQGGFAGIDDPRLERDVDLARNDADPWGFARAVATRQPHTVGDMALRAPAMPAGPWATPPHTAIVLPLGSPDRAALYGILVLGLNPHRGLDDGYRSFCELAAAQVVTALRNVHAAEEAQRRVDALATLARAKTAFFSNVSHEFRTPLTLMLGPLEELIARGDLPADARAAVDLAHRNAVRLLKLVNALLDFSRVEAKRGAARFRPTDLGERVRDLTGSFRSAIEKAGLRLRVDCEPQPEPAYVDADLFEKVLLNLLSNALKYTLAGEIAVELRYADRVAELRVRDTGIGMAEAELPKIFDRFYRVEGAAGRSIEGTGIGLALVKELVAAHGGDVAVESRLGAGTTFTVSLPLGRAHLPSAEVFESPSVADVPAQAEGHVQEALLWLAPQVATAPAGDGGAGVAGRPRILVVDDNADMRGYLERLLSPLYEVELVEDGRLALAAALARPPDLVLTDVMMPGLDGFALLAELRGDVRTRAVAVVMLSARASEEAGIEGLRSGADDYVVKPFTADELRARIGSSLRLVRMRGDLATAEAHARSESANAATLAQRNAELARLNDELEQFTYVSAHDLREPLRMVTQFMGLLDRDLGPGLADRDRRHLRYAVEAATRMQALISDLLTYTRLSRAAGPSAPVELDAVLGEVVDRLRAAIDGAGATVEIGRLPVVRGVHANLVVLFGQLLDNAIAFRSQRPPRIAVRAEAAADAWLVQVEDNGIGIDPAYHDRIFRIFQRLHTPQEYPGTGIGLAICRMVAHQHGGEITVDSEPGRGARFTVRLPMPASP